MNASSRSLVIPLIALACLTSTAQVARAGVRGDTTVEWMTTTSDVVVRGKVVGVDREAPGPRVRVHVAETLKGVHHEIVFIDLPSWVKGKAEKKWEDEKVEVLLFLNEQDAVRNGQGPLRPLLLQFFGRPGAYPLDGSGDPIYGMSLKKLADRDEILSAVRRSSAVVPRRTAPEAFMTHIVPEEYAKRVYTGSGLVLVHPLDKQLEAHARKWAEPGQENRHWGIIALKHFRSDENIRFIYTFLDDPDDIPITTEGKRIYLLRQLAYDTLSEWGEKVKAPGIDVP